MSGNLSYLGTGKWNLGSGNGESAWLSGVYLVAELGSDTKGGALKRGGYRAMACGEERFYLAYRLQSMMAV